MSCPAILAYVVIGHAPPAVAQVDQPRAQEYFKETQALCERDGGRLWGVSLCGPMVIADAATGTIATSQPAPTADRPRELGYVNAPVQWGGITWSAYTWQMIGPLHQLVTQLFDPQDADCVDGRRGEGGSENLHPSFSGNVRFARLAEDHRNTR